MSPVVVAMPERSPASERAVVLWRPTSVHGSGHRSDLKSEERRKLNDYAGVVLSTR